MGREDINPEKLVKPHGQGPGQCAAPKLVEECQDDRLTGEWRVDSGSGTYLRWNGQPFPTSPEGESAVQTEVADYLT